MKKAHIFSFLLVLLILLPSVSFSTAYKWVDENGKVWITDYKGPISDEKVTEQKTVAPSPEDVQKSQQAQSPQTEKAQTKIAAAPNPAPAGPKQITAGKTATTDPKQVTAPKPVTSPAPAPVTTTALKITPANPAQTAVPAPVKQSVSPQPLPFNLPKELPKYPGVNKQIPALPAYATALIAGGFAGLFLLIYLVFYIYCSLCQYLIAKKLDVGVAWLSWIPVLQVWPMLRSAGKPCWWVLTFFIPVFNIFFFINVCMCMTENLGRNKWLGLLFLLPVINLVFLGLLAFSKDNAYEPGLSPA